MNIIHMSNLIGDETHWQHHRLTCHLFNSRRRRHFIATGHGTNIILSVVQVR